MCRLKPIFLANSRAAREAPTIFAMDEQIAPCHSKISGAKKRMPKKNGVGLEYRTIATANKYYEGYTEELRAEPEPGKGLGKLIRAGDPICGGYKIAYSMDGGPRYEFGSTASSKTFGAMIFLIFSCGTYLRYNSACCVTDSAYGAVESMVFLSLWEILWISSLRIKQRMGFLGLEDVKETGEKSRKSSQ